VREGRKEEGGGGGGGRKGAGEGCEVCPWPTASLSHFACVSGGP
jgi:hypothetical protein